MLTAVAIETGQDVFRLVDRPLWQLLYTFCHLQERAERRALSERLARVDAGYMTAYAFNQPASLADEMQRVRDAIAALDRPVVAQADDSTLLRAAGEALAARIESGRVLDPRALVS